MKDARQPLRTVYHYWTKTNHKVTENSHRLESGSQQGSREDAGTTHYRTFLFRIRRPYLPRAEKGRVAPPSGSNRQHDRGKVLQYYRPGPWLLPNTSARARQTLNDIPHSKRVLGIQRHALRAQRRARHFLPSYEHGSRSHDTRTSRLVYEWRLRAIWVTFENHLSRLEDVF